VSVHIPILDVKTDHCITSYFIHIHGTDWSYDAKGKGAGNSAYTHTSGSTTVRKHRGHRLKEQGTRVEGTLHILASP